jgi:hypothetical protein
MISSPHGYYTVNNQIYVNKAEALYASKGNPVTWNYNDTIFSALDWTKRPTGTLKDLYKERAQQLRDKYDYLVINFSGGADSWNVLNAFLSNNIKIDEIFTRWARAERKYRDANNVNISEENLGSEFEYAVLPVLEQIKKTHPEINIVINDYSDGFTKEFEERQMLQSNQYQMMPSPFRFTRKSEFELIAEKHNKSVGIVYGCDKIRCCVINGDFYSYFLDCIGGNNLDPSRTFEVFYWSTEFPQLPILQAHEIKDYLKESINDKSLGFAKDLEENQSLQYNRFQSYRDLYIKICYPEYDNNTFQVLKGWGGLICKSDLWIPKFNPRYYQSWKWNTDQLYNSIDKKFMSMHHNVKNLVVGFKPIPSKKYLIEKNCGIPDIMWEGLNL